MKKHRNIQMEVLGTLGCMNNADFEKKKVNDNIMRDAGNSKMSTF